MRSDVRARAGCAPRHAPMPGTLQVHPHGVHLHGLYGAAGWQNESCDNAHGHASAQDMCRNGSRGDGGRGPPGPPRSRGAHSSRDSALRSGAARTGLRLEPRQRRRGGLETATWHPPCTLSSLAFQRPPRLRRPAGAPAARPWAALSLHTAPGCGTPRPRGTRPGGSGSGSVPSRRLRRDTPAVRAVLLEEFPSLGAGGGPSARARAPHAGRGCSPWRQLSSAPPWASRAGASQPPPPIP